ncbi:hypothetical protein [Streptomyces sp. XD-27]|uniref:hypothetical protein n=1 Tax=Streptomyces sp. XD-27 TaxID=3062779 RepID=UPI0026F42BE4|nr:hypothetical protein [Streptomyces sp. XD-27]WKX71316.1 hypothetical protein Q3Y56_16660 [Streptomyces sp. XD-27]
MPAHAPLRRILAMDAAGMIVFGLVYLLVSGPLARLLGVGDKVVLTSGGLMLTIGVGVAVLAGRARPPAASVRLVVAIGIAWVAASVASLVLDWWHPNAVGTVWTVLQAIPVSVFAILQLAALRGRT